MATSKKYADSESLRHLWIRIRNAFSSQGHTHQKNEITDLPTVAKSGEYKDLINKPDIPTTLPANGGKADDSDKLNGHTSDYYAKASGIPTKTSDLENDSGYITVSEINNLPSGSSAQSDWNENDTASPAFIKNRPMYAMFESIEISDEEINTLALIAATVVGLSSSEVLPLKDFFIPIEFFDGGVMCLTPIAGEAFDAAKEVGGITLWETEITLPSIDVNIESLTTDSFLGGEITFALFNNSIKQSEESYIISSNVDILTLANDSFGIIIDGMLVLAVVKKTDDYDVSSIMGEGSIIHLYQGLYILTTEEVTLGNNITINLGGITKISNVKKKLNENYLPMCNIKTGADGLVKLSDVEPIVQELNDTIQDLQQQIDNLRNSLN